ncbi:hypothetical protein M885DRAFT_519359 [Pelagophyceae sp. CCMP2097]|nr:hypothetical protein M885DRAFT_519359 [Pelagophyceae sp. CCMP2097]
MEAPHWALEHGLLRAAFARRVASCVMLWAIASAGFSFAWAMLFGGSSLAEAVFFGGAAAVVVTAERVAASGAWACANALPLHLRLGMAAANAILGALMGLCVGASDGAALGGAIVGLTHALGASRRFAQVCGDGSRAGELEATAVECAWRALASAVRAAVLAAVAQSSRGAFLPALHAAFSVALATDVGAALVATVALHPLDYDLVAKRAPPRAGATKASVLLAAVEAGDPPATGEALKPSKTAAPQQQGGWYANAPTSKAAPAGRWRADVDELRSAVWRLASTADLDRGAQTWLQPISPLALNSGGLVLGSNRVPLALRACKYIAVRDLARCAADFAHVEGFATRAIRACLLLVDGLTLRLQVASGKRSQSLDAERRVIGAAASFDWAADALSEQPFQSSEEPISPLEARAVISAVAAIRVVLSALEASNRDAPLVLCSFAGALNTLRDSAPALPRNADSLRCIEDAVHTATMAISGACAPHLALYAFPSIYVPTLQRYIQDVGAPR